MFNLVIVGAGDFARELEPMLWDVFPKDEYRLKGFLGRAGDASATRTASPLLGDPDTYQPADADRFLLAVGSMPARVRLANLLEHRGAQFVSFVHPRAFVMSTAKIGSGAVIYPLAVVSHAVRLERFVHLSYFASAGHDCQVGEFCLLAPYATLNGCCQIEPEVYLSTHATVVPGRRVGKGAKVSANSAVMQDVPAGSLVFGVPGRCVRNVPA
jgi:sugar O-acyltransferase (sialic acid O-acetyltransferase NeuD family)